MCTVTYIPRELGTFTLTHSRDESIKRVIASPPMKRMIGGVKHLFPVDPAGMGTWIGIAENGRAAGLLNGGKTGHTHAPPYKHSRGLIIPAYFNYSGFMEFYENYDFEGLEPFTLLAFEDGKIYEAVLDETGISFRELPADKPFIYSSSTLYSDKTRSNRNIRFLEWYFTGREIGRDAIFTLHKKFNFEDEADKSKVPPGHILRTVSITSVVHERESISMDYLDLVNDIRFVNQLALMPVTPVGPISLQ